MAQDSAPAGPTAGVPPAGTAPDAGYPAHWEADVLLTDGTVAHLRPIRPADADLLVAFYGRVSEESKYLRFFAPYPRLSRRDVARFTEPDVRDRVGLIVTVGADMVAVGRFDRSGAPGTAPGRSAEVAFLVEDAHQGRGLASVLLEHLSVIAREVGISAFTAHVLPHNERMARVFDDAGYTVRGSTEDDVLLLDFPLAPTAASVAVTQAREQRAEARSVERMLRPRGIAVVGASREPGKVGHQLVRNLLAGDVAVPVHPVNPEAGVVAGIPAVPRVRDIAGPVDLAVVAVPADRVAGVVEDCAAKGVHALVVVSGGFADAGPAGERLTADLLARTRREGMRVLGPASLGVVADSADGRLNASLAETVPDPGGAAVFSQSGALAIGLLQRMRERGIGLSSFVSAGNRLDVSVNDMLQYWDEDQSTDLVLLYLESVGNPRKFSRLVRRVGRRKPVVSVRVGRTVAEVPVVGRAGPGLAGREEVDAVLGHAGVVLVDTVAELFDVAAVLSAQPLPPNERVAVIGNSRALGRSVADAAVRAGLGVGAGPVVLANDAGPAAFADALAAAVADPAVGSAVVFVAPTLGLVETDVAAAVDAAATGPDAGATTVVTAFLGVHVPPGHVPPGTVRVPRFGSAEEALRALAAVVRYSRWRAAPSGRVPSPDGVDPAAARAVLDGVRGRLARRPPPSGEPPPPSGAEPSGDQGPAPEGVRLSAGESGALLAAFGVEVVPAGAVTSADEAVELARRLWADGPGPVVLKAAAWRLRNSPDQRDVWRNLVEADGVREAFTALAGAYGGPRRAQLVVQRQVAPGVPVAVELRQDEVFGPILSFGLGGVATELLGDRAHRIPPLTDRDADTMVRQIRAAPLLFGYRGGEPVDTAAVADLLHRVSALAEALPAVTQLELDPVLAGPDGLAVLRASVRIAAVAERPDSYRRQLPTAVG